MKNKMLLTLLAALGMAASQNAKATTFANVSFLGGSDKNTVNGRSYTTITTDQRWTRDKVYVLDCITFIATGCTVTIEPGTLVRGEIHTVVGDSTDPTKPSDPGTLVVCNGAKLVASGTSDAPINFTSIDNPTVPGGLETIPPYENYGISTGVQTVGSTTISVVNGQRVLRTGGTLVGLPTAAEYSYSGGTEGANIKSYAGNKKYEWDGLWGGLMFAGKARCAYGTYSGVITSSGSLVDPTGAAGLTNNGGEGRQYLEGLQAVGSKGMYGGLDDTDSSGTLRFVSNTYGGFVLSIGKEINGFTFGGVGSGTVVEFCESFNNADDDFEFFGGTVGISRCIGAFGGDDGFDTDQGYRGVSQFWIQIQNDCDSSTIGQVTGRTTVNIGDNMFEIDGPEPSTSDIGVVTMRPFTIQTVANATIIGRGYGDQGVLFGPANCGPQLKNAGALRLYNSVIMDAVGGGIAVKTGAPYNFFVNDSNGLYGDDTLQASSTATSGGEKYSVFNGNIWWRCALLEVSTNTKANIQGGTLGTSPTAGYGNDNSGYLFGKNGKDSSAADVTSVITQSGTANQFNVDPGLTVPLYHHISGLDLRSTSSAARTGGINLPARGNLTRVNASGTAVKFVGAMRNSNWAKNWTALDRLGFFDSGSTVISPNVTIGASGANPKVAFNTVNGALYSVEKSTDNKMFTPIDIVEGNGGDAEVTDATATIGATPYFYRVIVL